MILVLLGTQDKSFERLLKAIDKCILDGQITEKVIVQAGFTKFSSDNMEVFDFASKDSLTDYIIKANYIITHGGVGSILDCIRRGKKVIAVPRLKEHKEHTNNHQLQILKEFDKLGYIIPAYDVNELTAAIKKINKFKPTAFKHNSKMVKMIEEFIKEVDL